jgi:hypothetical protein
LEPLEFEAALTALKRILLEAFLEEPSITRRSGPFGNQIVELHLKTADIFIALDRGDLLVSIAASDDDKRYSVDYLHRLIFPGSEQSWVSITALECAGIVTWVNCAKDASGACLRKAYDTFEMCTNRSLLAD